MRGDDRCLTLFRLVRPYGDASVQVRTMLLPVHKGVVADVEGTASRVGVQHRHARREGGAAPGELTRLLAGAPEGQRVRRGVGLGPLHVLAEVAKLLAPMASRTCGNHSCSSSSTWWRTFSISTVILASKRSSWGSMRASSESIQATTWCSSTLSRTCSPVSGTAVRAAG